MTAAAIIAIIQALAAGVPKLIELIRQGRSVDSVKLGEFISRDALEKIRRAGERADNFIAKG